MIRELTLRQTVKGAIISRQTNKLHTSQGSFPFIPLSGWLSKPGVLNLSHGIILGGHRKIFEE